MISQDDTIFGKKETEAAVTQEVQPVYLVLTYIVAYCVDNTNMCCREGIKTIRIHLSNCLRARCKNLNTITSLVFSRRHLRYK